MKNQNPDHAPEMNLNQGKNHQSLGNVLKKKLIQGKDSRKNT